MENTLINIIVSGESLSVTRDIIIKNFELIHYSEDPWDAFEENPDYDEPELKDYIESLRNGTCEWKFYPSLHKDCHLAYFGENLSDISKVIRFCKKEGIDITTTKEKCTGNRMVGKNMID